MRTSITFISLIALQAWRLWMEYPSRREDEVVENAQQTDFWRTTGLLMVFQSDNRGQCQLPDSLA
jgi:hypothetical protein